MLKIRASANIRFRLLKRVVDLYSSEAITGLGSIQVKQPTEYTEIVRSAPQTLGTGCFVIDYHGNSFFKVSILGSLPHSVPSNVNI